MNEKIFECLEKDYRYLSKIVKEIDDNLFKTPHTSIIKSRTFSEFICNEVAKIEGYESIIGMNQVDRVNKLREEGLLTEEIDRCLYVVRQIGNKAAHSEVKGELQAALNVHRHVFDIAKWFIEVYLDPNIDVGDYEEPKVPESKSESLGREDIEKMIREVNEAEKEKEKLDAERVREIENAYIGLAVESIINNEPDRKCIVQQLAKLKESSKEAVENLGEFSDFKNYMHIPRETQRSLEDLIIKSNDSNKAQLILVCGSVGDGKSHVISYCKNKHKDIMKDFCLHNDATESLEPTKTSMDTLNDVLDEFSDEKIDTSNQKLILAINLGTLNNFIDSKYGYRFTKLKDFVQDKKILENSIEDSTFDENSSFQYVNFSDYHLFNLKNGKVNSEYIKDIIKRITRPLESNFVENNIFYSSYKRNCLCCDNKDCCPIKANYELLSQENVQNAIVDLLVQCIIKNKIIISTRALLNFMYELIVPRSYIDVNSSTLKNNIKKLSNVEYIQSLMPNIIFDHKELSFIFESLNTIDPLNIRNEKVDDFIIDFNNSNTTLDYFNEYIDLPKGYLGKINTLDSEEIEKRSIKHELLKLFIRSYYMCNKEELFSLRDEDYDDYINALFYWNKGEKSKLQKFYNNVKSGIINWNGEAEQDHINIFLGKNQLKYKVSESIKIKADFNNLPMNNEDNLEKFIGTLKLRFKGAESNKTHDIDIDYKLYKLLVKVNNGYRPNKKDKNHFINFIEFINKVVEGGSQDKELIFTEKNREENKRFKLEYDDEFETYKFVEI